MEPSTEDFELELIGQQTRDAEETGEGVQVEFLAHGAEADLSATRLSVSQVLSFLGFGWFTLFLFFALGMAFAADAFELLVLSFVLPALDLGLTDLWQTAIMSLSFLGFGLGAFFWGVIGDRFGRKRAYTAVLLCLLVLGYLQLLSFNLALVLCWRFAMGFAVGGVATGYALFAEFLPTHSRSLWLNLFQTWFAFGSLLGASLACLVLDADGQGNWRLLLILGSIPTILALLAVPFLPASLRFLALREKGTEICATVARIAQWQSKDTAGITVVAVAAEQVSSSRFASIRPIFESSLRRTTIVLSLAWFSCSFCYYGVILFSPLFFRTLGLSPCLLTIFTSLVEIVFLAVSGIVSSYLGRRVTIAASFSLCAISLLAMYAAMLFELPTLLVLLVSMTARGGSSVAFAVTALYTVEMYPTRVRATGYGFCNAVSRLAGIATPWIALPLLEFGMWIPIVMYASVALGTALLLMLGLKKETRFLDLED